MEVGCVGMQVQRCAGQLFITITQYQRWSTYKHKFGVCSQFWSFQSMVIWFHAIGHVARQHIIPEQNHSQHHQEAKENEFPQAPSKTRLQPLKDTLQAHISWRFILGIPLFSPVLPGELQDLFSSVVKPLWNEDTFGTLAVRNITQKQPVWSHHWRSLLKETDYLYWHVTVLDTTKKILFQHVNLEEICKGSPTLLSLMWWSR